MSKHARTSDSECACNLRSGPFPLPSSLFTAQGDTCAPLRSVVPWLRNATNDAELRAAIDVAYDELDGSAGSPLGGTEAAWREDDGRGRAALSHKP